MIRWPRRIHQRLQLKLLLKCFVTFTETNEDNQPGYDEIEDNLVLETSEPGLEAWGVDGECSLEDTGGKVVGNSLFDAGVHGVVWAAPPELTEGRHTLLTLGPGVAPRHRLEAVSEVDKHPGGDHETIDPHHPLDQHQGDSDPLHQGECVDHLTTVLDVSSHLEYRGYSPHVNEPGPEVLATRDEESQERYPETQR